MHALQPMHSDSSKSTRPSSRWYIAVTGQISTHGASSQWLQRSTAKWRRTAGNSPTSTFFTQVRNTPRATSFSDLQAGGQAGEPIHFVLSVAPAPPLNAGTKNK